MYGNFRFNCIQVICLAITTFPRFDCKETNATSIIKNLVVNINNVTAQHNETIPLQKNSTTIAQKNETAVVKNDNLETNRKSKTRQVSENNSESPTAAVTDDMDAQQSFYPSALMVYPFPMMNTYYPRYFPYTYPSGYHGYPIYG